MDELVRLVGLSGLQVERVRWPGLLRLEHLGISYCLVQLFDLIVVTRARVGSYIDQARPAGFRRRCRRRRDCFRAIEAVALDRGISRQWISET